MGNKELFFEITKIMNNIKNHDFTVQNYRMTPEEAKVVVRALKHYKYALQLKESSTADIFDKIGDDIKRFDEDTKNMFDVKKRDNGD